VHFTVQALELDTLGRVLDFSVIKSRLCMWLEDNWDHRFLLWQDDPILLALQGVDPQSVVAVPFNPTAERMAEYLVEVIGPKQLHDTGCHLVSCRVEETRKCSAEYLI
jgi:6-pyruvoyltetrahydropterin/6-carboxytetrahydropterin synthase